MASTKSMPTAWSMVSRLMIRSGFGACQSARTPTFAIAEGSLRQSRTGSAATGIDSRDRHFARHAAMTKIKKSLHTELGHSTPDRITVRGRDLPSEILGHLNLGDMAFLELTGRTPTPQESVTFNAIVVTLVEHGITPRTIVKPVEATLVTAYEADYFKVPLEIEKFDEYSPKQLKETIHQLEAEMRHAAKEMKFERAAELRDRLKYLRERELEYV